MNVHFGSPNQIKTIGDAVPRYGAKEFESATRSTVPMLSLLIHARDEFNKIIGDIGFPDKYDLFLEYTVGPFSGEGKASHSDVMLKAGEHSLAIEGKWTEPMYSKVKNWPERGVQRTDNQNAVLNGWLEVLGQRVGTNLDVDNFGETIYQMVHRAASAAVVGKKPRMAYFLFKPSPKKGSANPDDIFKKLADLWDQLGKPSEFPFYLVEIKIERLAAYDNILKFQKDKERTSEAVCAALQGPDPLFAFEALPVREIGQKAAEA